MNINIRYSTIINMLDICEDLLDGKDVKTRLNKILDHEDYVFEFNRYDKRVNKSEYIEYFLNARNLSVKEITNPDLKAHHDKYLELFSNIQYYKKKLFELKDILSTDLFQQAAEVALKGLPKDFKIPNIDFIFTIGIGQSFGYVYKNGTHYDFLSLVKENLQEFFAVISHEIHHICMNKLFKNEYTPEEYFYIAFSGEGLAVKYCNNAEGVISKSLDKDKKNNGLDTFTWDYLNNKFEEGIKMYLDILKDIKSKKLTSIEDVNKVLFDKFMIFHTDEQSKDEVPKLKQSLLYSLGNDLWGMIHDYFGKETVYKIIEEPSLYPKYYNKVMIDLGRNDLLIK